MYDKVSADMHFCEREQKVIEFWKERDVFEKSVKKNEGKPSFSFYDGPPTANGKPHIGHILTRVMKDIIPRYNVMKDIIPRYKTMKGYHVLRKAGWDTHGLPVELEVEKQLGMDGKQDIEKYGVEPFIKKCKESVWKYKHEWERMSERVGHPYITYDDNYIESVWWMLKTVFDKGLIYKGFKIVPYCPRCGTALSSHEVAQGYKDVKERSCIAKFRRVGAEGYFLAWTTTPWTLPSNVALCMNPDEEYAEIRSGGEVYVLAKALVPTHFEEYEILSVKTGKEYEYASYEPLFDCYNGKQKAFYVTCDNYVTLTDGTGVVHIAPAFGEDDANVGRKYNLPFLQMVDERGRFVKGTHEKLDGVFCKDGDRTVMMLLQEKGLLFKDMMYEHSYPFCWRCDTPLLYYARSSWFIKMTEVRDQLLKNNASVNWIPPSIGTGRMGNFLENVIDWGISRERYWGTPLPFWVCECGHVHAIGSREELRRLGGLDHDIELHKPYIDEVTIKCPVCGKTMHRTPEVLDCWGDSGSMPFAQFHYPFENKELFESQFPADFISEAVDQTRGWFYTLLAVSTLMFDKAPFKNCVVLGHVNDKNGIKMSKHKGNVVDPWSVLDKQGADAVRWYFYSSSAPWLPSRFSADNVSESQRKFMGTLWNTYAFFVLYAEIDGYDPSKYSLDKCALTQMDRWLLSGLNTLVRYVDECLDKYMITESARAIQEFADNLSNWYVRRGRERYWGSEMTEDKKAAYTTLYHTLVTLSKLCAPFVPFMSECIYRNLVTNFFPGAPESVHLCDFPVCEEKYIDKDLEADMDIVLRAVALGRAARNKVNIKNRQPLSKMYVMTDKLPAHAEILSLAADELNVKAAEIVQDDSGFISYEIKPQLKTLGPKYGKLIGAIRTFLTSFEKPEEIVAAVSGGGTYTANIGGEEVSFTQDDLLITPVNKGGYAMESYGGMTVVLDTNLTEELIDEGVARELVSKLQTMRKEAGYNVTDRINIGYVASGRAEKVLQGGAVKADVLCDKIESGTEGCDYVKEWDVNGEKVTLGVKKA